MKDERNIRFDREETEILQKIEEDLVESDLTDMAELEEMIKAAENTLRQLKNGGNNGI